MRGAAILTIFAVLIGFFFYISIYSCINRGEEYCDATSDVRKEIEKESGEKYGSKNCWGYDAKCICQTILGITSPVPGINSLLAGMINFFLYFFLLLYFLGVAICISLEKRKAIEVNSDCIENQSKALLELISDHKRINADLGYKISQSLVEIASEMMTISILLNISTNNKQPKSTIDNHLENQDDKP